MNGIGSGIEASSDGKEHFKPEYGKFKYFFLIFYMEYYQFLIKYNVVK